MPLHVLLADDSVPAQNMGKKILADAGYCVQTVSNGLEALRKIAEHAPDIAILDIFMPGYTGLEICERLRASAATATLPVILTVGKLAPYRPEDGEHVHSNAVIVKPFAAAELVSAVRSLIGTEATHSLDEGADLASDPLERNAAAGVVFAGPLAADSPATPGRVEESREAAADEPLLPSIAATGSKAPGSPREPSIYTDAPFPSGADSNEPHGLTFNPDAKSTPFSASALDDLMPSTSRFTAEDGASSFTEFDLEPESSDYSSAPEPLGSSTEEPLASVAGMAGPEPEVVMPEAVAPKEILSGLGVAQESASALDVPALDPLLDVHEAAPSMASVVSMDTVEPLEAFTPEIAAVDSEPVPDSSAGPLSPEEEDRRLAFEALFNSSEPLPLDDFYASPPEGATVLLPNIAESAKDHPDVFAPDFEIEYGHHQEFISPEPTKAKLDEAEPLSAIEMIPERDPLLENPLEEANLPEIEVVPEVEKASASISSEIDSPQFSEATEPTPESAVMAPVEPPQVIPEPEVASAAQIAEVEPLEFEATPEQVEAVPELAEVQQILLEDAPSETPQAAMETMYSVPELLLALPEPEIATPTQIAGTAPTLETEPLEVEATPEQVEAVPELAEVQRAVLDAAPCETEQVALEAVYSVPALPHALPEPEIAATAPIAEAAPTLEIEPLEVEPTPEQLESAPEPAEVPQVVPEATPVLSEPEAPEMVHPELHAAETSSPELSLGADEAERVSQAVDRVFDRFKRLLVAAIVRELARPD